MDRTLFTALPRPIVTCILREPDAATAVATIKNGEFEGAHAFALHLEDWRREDMTEENFRRVVQATRRPVMFLRYRDPQPTAASLTDEERVALLTRAVECGASATDFTADTFDPSPCEFTRDPEAVDRQRRAIDRVHELGGEVIMSSHIYAPRTCEQVLEQMKAVEERGADFAKIVTIADTEEEYLEAVRTTLALRREMRVPFIHLCGGRFALPHRYLSPMLGNHLTFCVQRYTERFITPQPPLRNMLAVLQNANWNIDR